MTDTTEQQAVTVAQIDRDAVQAFHRKMLDRLMSDVKSQRPKLGDDEGDAGTLVQAFARHRIATQPATSQEGNKSFASWSTETLAQQCRMQGRDQLDPEFSGFLVVVADRLAALATQPATSQEAQQQARAGTHLLKKAREDGWVDDGEGAYEYIVRRAYEAGMRYSTAATPTPPTLSEDLRGLVETARDDLVFLLREVEAARPGSYRATGTIRDLDAALAQVKAS